MSILHNVIAMKKIKENAIRRINIGGKLITNLYKEAISYRQWNMMDEFFIMNEVKEKTSFVSENFKNDLVNHAKRKRPGHRWFDREFVLPNFVNTFSGSIRLSPPLRKKQIEEDKEKLQIQEKKQSNKIEKSESSLDQDEKLDENIKAVEDVDKDENDEEADSDQETEE